MTTVEPFYYTSDPSFLGARNATGELEFLCSNHNSFNANNTTSVFIMPTRNCDLFMQNNTLNTVSNTDVNLYNTDGSVLIGTGNTDATPTVLGAIERNKAYIVTFTTPAQAGQASWLSKLFTQYFVTTRTYFPDGIEISPSKPVGIVSQEQLYGNQYFNFQGFTSVAGQQYTLCFADVAIQAGTLRVTSFGGCIGSFTSYVQPFSVNSSLIVIVVALTTTTFAAGSEIRVTIDNVATTVTSILAPIVNSSVFANVNEAFRAQQDLLRLEYKQRRSIEEVRTAEVLPKIEEVVKEVKRESISMEEEVQSYEPQQKHQRIY